jgi:hypothetical protein
LLKLVQQTPIVDVSPADPTLYTEGKPESFCVVVVKGSIVLNSSNQVIEVYERSPIGIKALIFDQFIPSFTTSIPNHASVIKITKRAYSAAVQATLFERGDPDSMFVDDF